VKYLLAKASSHADAARDSIEIMLRMEGDVGGEGVPHVVLRVLGIYLITVTSSRYE